LRPASPATDAAEAETFRAAPASNRPGSNPVGNPIRRPHMKLRTLLAAAAMALASTAALANHCPMDMKAIDAALAKNPSLTPEQLAEVKKYRAEGEALHKAGKHQESVDTLAKAMKVLGIK
jgi:hypothetical protein